MDNEVEGNAAERFRELSNRLAKGVAVVSARHRGHDVARTVTDVITVSWDPPTVMVSLYSLGRMAEALEAESTFAVSFLSADQRWIAQWLAEPGTPTIGLLDQIPHRRLDPAGPALIEGASAGLVVRKEHEFEVATHTLFAGGVVAMVGAGARPSALLRHRGDYIQVGDHM
ncbi:flavin reductase family protein [Rarobacter incanus]|uniref:Flavin reductase (DIM6/NTAB) family NADH-FMN oxidoreductase RutF n=1 Tax=Rarobacter incanus TaxID=153494 RepID=A0A542SQT9_9MICO|nr:flavin reductase family protein [Rarobacter incanus]TQK76965.1 flavin reductase (DIM6/NTAB) family NADH-FMN oxidoreductase RutF [Rarobacter incanus]